ncbi:Pinin [Nymphon striatum]|nr:Pinin [Nymphon striatum]
MMYVESLIELMPWFFALDRTNYSRWLSVHIRDMENLPIKHPEILKQFKAGKFTFQKTEHAFSSMPLDQAHEQNNLLVKGDGGAIGLTESPQALRRWMVGGPEIARLIQEFEQTMHTKPENSHHHEQTSSHQSRFKTHVQAMVNTINDLGNQFCDESKELFSLCSKIVADPAVIKTINEIKETGLHQYQAFVKERLVQQSKPLHECIRQNKFAVFKDRPRKSVTSNSKLKLKSAKSDCQLFARLYIGCQNRGSNIDDFFSHENQAYPPSISDGGRLRQGTKADLIQCFDKLHETQLNEPKVSAVIVDGAAVVQILKPGTAKTFQDYSQNVFVPYIAKLLAQVSRVDVVWDVYQQCSLKSSTRERRGTGSRRKVLPFVNVILIANNGKEVFATDGPDVLCAPDCEDLSSVSPCSHEEADTRIFVHCMDAALKGHKSIMIRTVDTDVVLAVATFHILPVDELWIAFGTGNKFRYLPAHEYACTLGPEKSKSLPLFHALTGCDTVSSFLGCGKKTAWDVWMTFDESTTAFLELTTCPTDISDDCMAVIERFVVLLYNRGSELNKVNDARKHLFTKKGRSIESIPPSQAALLQHVKRAIYQGVHIWWQTLVVQPVLPDPLSWGWILDSNMYRPLWTTLPEAAKICLELTSAHLLRNLQSPHTIIRDIKTTNRAEIGTILQVFVLDTREEERRHRRRNSDEDEEEYTNKPSVQSSVISNPNKLLIKTRRDSLIELKNDKKVMDRNRRMFGLLLGTLQKFQSEQTQQKDKERKRQEIENKLEEAAVKEKEEVLKERKYLFLSRRKKQALLRRLERKVEIAKEFEDWEKLQKCYLHFIQTKAIPQIMYLPAKSTAVSEKRLSESSGEISDLQICTIAVPKIAFNISAQIEERRKKMQDEIQELDEQDQIEGANSEKDDIDDNAASENIVEGNENNVDVSSSPQNKINDLSDIIGQVDGTESTCADSVKEPLTHVNDVNDINSSKQPSSNEQEFEPMYD